jgi:hypothetical protein
LGRDADRLIVHAEELEYLDGEGAALTTLGYAAEGDVGEGQGACGAFGEPHASCAHPTGLNEHAFRRAWCAREEVVGVAYALIELEDRCGVGHVDAVGSQARLGHSGGPQTHGGGLVVHNVL